MNKREAIKATILDIIALAFIYFAPTLAHLLNFPVYMIEPMRLMLVISMALSGKTNSYILALTLPFFSYLVSGHPELVKMLIITGELALNVLLFFLLTSRIRNIFIGGFLSIVASKAYAYFMYFLFFSPAFVKSEADTTFLLIQLVTTLIFSGYLYFALKPSMVQNQTGQ